MSTQLKDFELAELDLHSLDGLRVFVQDFKP